jgi:RNA-directed DNA polymerase
MGTMATTIRATTNMSVSCAVESGLVAPFSFAAVWQAYQACRRRKRGTANAQRYEMQLLDQLVGTTEMLQQHVYLPSRSITFVAQQPKAREIHAADFSDRVVHHLLVPWLEALYEPIFIHDLYSNRKKRGIHMAVERLSHFMRAATENGGCSAHYLQLDIKNFFNTIDKSLLWKLLQQRIRKAARRGVLSDLQQQELLWLTHLLLKHDPTKNAHYRGAAESLNRVPKYKRLPSAPPNKGLPIGNLTSQFFANVYLNELDQFVKHQLKCRYYLRYVDDLILVHKSFSQLQQWEKEIEQFVAQQLQLTLKQQGIVRPVTDGADFLGYITRPDYRLVRRRVVGNLHQKLRAFEENQIRSGALLLTSESRLQIQAQLASYLGHFRHARDRNLLIKLSKSFPWLSYLFQLKPGCAAKPLWEPAIVSSLKGQWDHFKYHFPGILLFMRVGRKVELFREDITTLISAVSGIGQWQALRWGERVGMGQSLELSYTDYRHLGGRLRRAGIF